ncbi:hypothetical protein K8P10_000154 [Leucobacter sp. Psy1]|uniref:hypothetical protein n=1 Tax=Leucobacter sp. Psy1 TaxID=2875729 RepID=UPI001CD4DADD|nr:hypothetical protein [Leucobacter sp. Psy1]UBH04643.1 hypothetical protein K8P10_000154 [Leucobacter sp. Psy1]
MTPARGESVSGVADRGAFFSSPALVLSGVILGIYAVYTWAWFSWARFTADVAAALVHGAEPILGVTQQIVHWCAPAAPLLWCGTVWLMHRESPRTTLLRLVAGLIVLAPLPVFLD